MLCRSNIGDVGLEASNRLNLLNSLGVLHTTLSLTVNFHGSLAPEIPVFHIATESTMQKEFTPVDIDVCSCDTSGRLAR